MPMRRRVHRRRGVRLTVGLLFAAALSFTAGLTDVVGFLLAGDFVSFMSGNTTRLAISISEGDEARILHLAEVIAGFVVGNAAGVLLMRWTRGSHAALLVGLAAVMTGATLTGEATLTVLALVFSMGALNVALEEVAGHSVGVTYVTGALSRFGRGLGRTMLGEAATGWWIQVVPWLGMISGALAGAFLWREIDRTAIFAAAFAAALIGLASLAIPRRWRLGYLMRKPAPRRVPVARPRDAAPA